MHNIPTPLFDSLIHFKELPVNVIDLDSEKKADLNSAFLFLKSYVGSEGTFNSYRREVERLLHWCWLVKKKQLAGLTREDIEEFISFCQSPPATWIGKVKVAKFILKDGLRVPNKEWRPFVATISKVARKRGQSVDVHKFVLSEGATAEIFAILSTFFNFLITENKVLLNPVALIRQKSKFIRKRQQQAKVRRLSMLQWETILSCVDELAIKDPQTHERTRFMLTALFGMYLRISELAASNRWVPTMNHFFKDAHGNWWFTTVGKGNKLRQIAVSDAMLVSLVRWRTFLNLPAYPNAADTSPLIPKLNGKGPIKDTAWIRQIIQQCFDVAEDKLKAQGQQEEADALAAATVHWLRHTGISEDVKIRPREHVRDDAGHSSSVTTDRYIDVELAARHKSAKDKAL
ncbi:MAG: integrase [Legionellales bacterium RIFCSPHIGHO2_12_FULL_37_14]|nr:MAG: integrase [Legionellales bacterium RIFCSPHIGHO2_12_FULL_37_14]